MRITVYERNRADDTFGFGVVFSDETLETFEKYDLESYRAITANFAYWDDIEIHFKGTVHRIGGNGFCGCSRVTLLKLLHERARALGVELKFQTEIDPARAARCRPRRRGRRHQFAHPRAACRRVQARDRSAPEQVRLDGLDAPVRCLHVLLPRDRARHLHRALLPVRAGQSTWVMETDPETFARAGLDKLDEQQSAKFLEGVFAKELAGHKLIINRSLWRNFPTIRCETLDPRQHRADRRRQGDRAFLHRLRHQARDGGRDRAVQGVQRDRRGAM